MAEWMFLVGACVLAVFDTLTAQGQALLPARVLVAIALASKILRWLLALLKNVPSAVPSWRSALLALVLALVPSIGGQYGGNLLSSASIFSASPDAASGDTQGLAGDAVRGDVWDGLEVDNSGKDLQEAVQTPRDGGENNELRQNP
jgi:hypothetical protein